MSNDRSESMLRVIVNAAYDYYTKHGHYRARARVGSTFAGYCVKSGERQARIALRPSSTALWLTIVAGNGLGPMDIVGERMPARRPPLW